MKVKKRVLAVGSSDSEESLVSPLNVEKGSYFWIQVMAMILNQVI